MAISKTQLYVRTSASPISSAVKPVCYSSNKVWSIYRGRDLVWRMCKVKFVDWDSHLLEEQEVVFGHSAADPSDPPPREGYIFDGWYPSYSNIRCNTEVSAQYHQQTQQLYLSIDVFPPGTGTVVGAGPHDPGQRVTVNAIPEPGWVFQSWSDGGSQSHVVLMDQDKHLTANFSTTGIVVRFLDYDGRVIASQIVEYGGDATPPSDPTREGYHFSGWSGSYEHVTSSRNIIAQYTANVYTITFDPCGGTVDPISTTVEFDSEYGVLPIPEKSETLSSYFQFDNWIDSEQQPIHKDTPFTTASDQILSATWIELFKISVLRVEFGSHVLSVDCLYDGNEYWDELTANTDLNIILSSEWRAYAKAESGYIPYWTESTPLISTKGPDLETVVFKVKPIITWDSHGGTTVQPWNDRGAGEELGDLPNTERDGYAFAGWWTDEISGDEISSSTLVGDEDTTYHAHWVADDIITEVNSVFQTNSLDTNTISYQNKAYGYVYWNDNAGQVLPVWQPTLDKVFDNEEYLSQSLSGVHGTARAGSSSVDFTNGGRAGIVLSAMTPKSENSSLYTKVKILPYIVTNSYSTGGAIRQNGWYYTDRRPAPTAYGQNSDWSMNTNDSTGYLHFGYATYNRGQYFQVIMDVADEDGDHQISSDIVQCTGSYSTLDGQRSGSPSDVAPITIDLSQKIVDVGLKKDARTTKITFKQGTSSTAPQWAAAVNAVCLYEDTLNG